MNLFVSRSVGVEDLESWKQEKGSQEEIPGLVAELHGYLPRTTAWKSSGEDDYGDENDDDDDRRCGSNGCLVYLSFDWL